MAAAAFITLTNPIAERWHSSVDTLGTSQVQMDAWIVKASQLAHEYVTAINSYRCWPEKVQPYISAYVVARQKQSSLYSTLSAATGAQRTALLNQIAGVTADVSAADAAVAGILGLTHVGD